jgi:hypothetical protein
MASGLAPNFVRVFYTVAGFVHVLTRQLHIYIVPSPTHIYGQLTRWDDTTEDADTVMEAEITAWADLFTTDASFNSMFFYTQETDTAQPVLRAAKNISIPGTMAIVAGEEHLGVMVQFNFLTLTGDRMKLAFMEANSRNAYQKITNYTELTADEQTQVDYTLSDATNWASRDDSKPYIWRSRTCTLNRALRRRRGFI